MPLSKPVVAWPLLLCGPILRRVTPTSVAVFVALKQKSEVVLEIYKRLSPGTYDRPRQSILHYTVPLGKNLHVCVVEWRDQTPLATNQIYGYDVSIREAAPGTGAWRLGDLTPNLLVGPYKLGYDERLPAFSLPADLKSLKVVHGSCRKAHAPGPDALEVLDDLIKKDFTVPSQRPHHLLLTGDQIYADDVAVSLLATLKATAQDLLAWKNEEKMPRKAAGSPLSPGDPMVAPGPMRGAFINTETTFSSGLTNKRLVDAHLMFLGEFYAMYLFTWSDALWPRDASDAALPIRLPTAQELRADMDAGLQFVDGVAYQAKVDADRALVHGFASSLPRVRRALANVPTTMMFDDHDVTDDWYLHRKWATDARTNPPARQIIRNALLAYAVFQDWGNHPENYFSNTLGDTLLDWITYFPTELTKIGDQPAATDTLLDVQTARTPLGQRMRWDWSYSGLAGEYQIVALDTRTWRSFPTSDRGNAALIESDPTKTDAQLIATDVPLGFQLLAHVPTDDRVTILLSPAPLIGHPIAELAQKAMVLGGFNLSVPSLQAMIVSQTAVVDAILAENPPDWLAQKLHDWRLEHEQKALGQLQVRLAAAKVHSEVAADDFDNEAWSGNRIAYEDMLKRLAAFKRVVIVSGDVHYAFSNQVAYYRTGTAAPVAARIVQFCSSALKNEGDANRMLANVGYDYVPAAMGWLGFNRDLTALKADVKNALDTGLLSGAGTDPKVAHDSALVFFYFEMNDRFSNPAVIPSQHYTNALAFARIRDAARGPVKQDLTDWRYTIEYLQDSRVQSQRPADYAGLVALLSTSPTFEHYNRMMIGSGRAVVGANNIGHIRFSVQSGVTVDRVTHRICFQVPITAQATAQALMFTEHTASLELPGAPEFPEVRP